MKELIYPEMINAYRDYYSNCGSVEIEMIKNYMDSWLDLHAEILLSISPEGDFDIIRGGLISDLGLYFELFGLSL